MDPNFETVLKALSDTDKNRLVCCYLNSDPSSVNWEKAAKDFGSASIESMKVMTRYAIKKTEGGGGKAGGSAKPSKAGGKKRKGAEEGDNAETKPKKQRGKKAKGEAPKAEDGSAADRESPVKEESDELD